MVGGGVSKDADEFMHLIGIETEIVPAKLENRAGIVGAALWAAGPGTSTRRAYSAARAFSMSSRSSAGSVSGL